MIRYKLSTKAGDVFVSVDSQQPNKVSPLRYEGDPRAVLQVKRWLTYQVGADGREIQEWCAPNDLKVAMKAKNDFSPSLVEEKMSAHRAAGSDAEGGG